MPQSRLEAVCGEADAQWLRRMARGIDDEEVKERQLPKSLSCGKTFRGPRALKALPVVHRRALFMLTLHAEAVPHQLARRPFQCKGAFHGWQAVCRIVVTRSPGGCWSWARSCRSA